MFRVLHSCVLCNVQKSMKVWNCLLAARKRFRVGILRTLGVFLCCLSVRYVSVSPKTWRRWMDQWQFPSLLEPLNPLMACRGFSASVWRKGQLWLNAFLNILQWQIISFQLIEITPPPAVTWQTTPSAGNRWQL